MRAEIVIGDIGKFLLDYEDEVIYPKEKAWYLFSVPLDNQQQKLLQYVTSTANPRN